MRFAINLSPNLLFCPNGGVHRVTAAREKQTSNRYHEILSLCPAAECVIEMFAVCFRLSEDMCRRLRPLQ